MSVRSLQAQSTVTAWPEFSCSNGVVVITFVDLSICNRAATYSKVEVLAGATPTIVFEQGDKRFDALSYEPAEKALSGLPARLAVANAGEALNTLFSWRGNKNLTAKQQTLLQVFGIEAETQLMQFTTGDVAAYVRLNKGTADNTIFMIVGNSSHVYRVIGNFISVDV
ncbi:MAG: hypothetical protein KKE30_06205 [Gammaproteobacteria bacterium]|nr:hypothetical protein [Gammaproteobacteria bacterium]MBU1553560.1 hypothetical protein [Gammaproteobacteria bacterium]MBU2069975.1 hypothetical protein [Gammaproteobacteria bacterium]MBU2185120.1 hypothetical protein [Gammaproteobacteria bacterium]MBU2206988.1 hypothetical protein [Gammaproteobacteria bacterium]